MREHLAVASLLDRAVLGWARTTFKAAMLPLEERRGSREIELLSLSSQGFLRPRSETGDRQMPSSDGLPRYLVVHPGDLVVNPMWLSGGAIAVSDRFGAVSPDYRVFRPRPAVHGRFLHHVLRSAEYFDQYRLYTRADTTFDRRVQQPDLDQLPLALPTLEEQSRIAEFLDDQMSTLAAVLEQRVAQGRLVEEVCSARMAALFQGVEVRLKSLLKQYPCYGVLVPEFVVDGVPFIRVGDLRDLQAAQVGDLRQIPQRLSLEYRRTVVRAGDLLVGVVGSTDKAAVVPEALAGANIARAVARLVPREGVPTSVIIGWMETPSYVRQVESVTSGDTAQPTLNMGDLRNFRIPLPGLPLLDLAASVDQLRAERAACRAAMSRTTRLVEEHKRALITACVTGEFDVTTASNRAADAALQGVTR